MDQNVEIEKTVALKRCGLIMPISTIDGCSSEHWAEVKSIIQEALEGTDFIVELVSNSNEVGIIQRNIVTNIYNSDIVICDVSAKNPNVMFELGMRLAFDKPTVIIKDDKTDYTFDTSVIEHINYPRDLHYHYIKNFKKVLKEKTLATYEKSKQQDYDSFLKNFGAFKVAKVETHEVTSSEYLMQSIDEMRLELNSLNKNMRSRESRYFDGIVEALPPLDNKKLRDSLAKLSDEELVKIVDGESKLFVKSFSDYLQVSGTPQTRWSADNNMTARYKELVAQEVIQRRQAKAEPGPS